MAYTSLSDLRKSRGGFDSLMKEVEKIANPQSESNNRNDDRFWQPEVDKAGNGYAVIRFLAPPKGEDLPWVRIWNHGFQGPTGKWYIENSLTTIGKQDPVSELNTELWNSGSEANKEVARKQKRKLTYYANILVVKDPSRPDNEGKVFLFKFGKKIWDKVKDMADPQFEDEKPVNVFDFDTGANFKLKIRNVEGYRNYDKSEFAGMSALFDGDDEKLEALWKKEFSLKEFTEKSQFKSYDVLKARLDKVLGFEGVQSPRTKAETAVLDTFKEEDLAAFDKKVVAEADEEMDYFNSLADTK
jgi:hypothetical protein